jgi:predicted negative regulator of RcsB-dependent stress response
MNWRNGMRMNEAAKCTVCRQPLGHNGRCQHCDDNGHHTWTIQDWRPLLTLGLVIVLGFSFTSLVVNGFRERQSALAAAYYQAGLRAMDAKQFAAAVDDFETALVYSHDNFQYRLKLTDALLASGATGEALAQLRAFWDQRPGDAEVNLKLARLEAQRNHADDALRYYQNAIEGAWPERTDPIPQRIATRFEAAEYLVQQGRQEQAEAALLALASALPSNSPEQEKLGDLFMRNGDPARALSAYQAQVNQNKNDDAAILGAAKASYAAGNYATARRYLVELRTETAESRGLLAQLERMEALDPFSRGATPKLRIARTIAVFRIAIERLAACGVPFAQPGGAEQSANANQPEKPANVKEPEQWSGFQKWAEQLSPLMSERKLRGRDDVIESTMRFAFRVETSAQKDCGKLTLNDEALLLLARERMGANR